MTWPIEIRNQVLRDCRAGEPYREVSARYGIPRGTVGYWVHRDRVVRGVPAPPRESFCPRCDGAPFPEDAYAYVLGLYLGDGHIVSRKRQHHLAISCCDAWPGLIEAAEAAVKAVLPRYATRRRRRRGCTDVESHTRHWVCMLPQHGPGRKHEREITLEPWQREIVRRHPWPLIRGLIHSDGCRITNWATRTVAGERKRYEYPRYFFTNTSADIVRLFTDTLDAVGVEWRVARRAGAAVNVSVARRGSVALMDRFVGAKY